MGFRIPGVTIGGGDPFQVGQNFQRERTGQAVGALESGFTGRIEADEQLRGGLREAFANKLGGLGGATSRRRNQFEGDFERGLGTSLASLRRNFGGTGLAGSAQGNRATGNVVGQALQQRNRGLQDIENQELQDLASILSGQQNIAGQGLQDRGFQLGQAQSLSQLLQQQANQEQNAILQTATPQGPSDLEKGLGIFGSLGGAAAGFFSGAPSSGVVRQGLGGAGGGSGQLVNRLQKPF